MQKALEYPAIPVAGEGGKEDRDALRNHDER